MDRHTIQVGSETVTADKILVCTAGGRKYHRFPAMSRHHLE